MNSEQNEGLQRLIGGLFEDQEVRRATSAASLYTIGFSLAHLRSGLIDGGVPEDVANLAVHDAVREYVRRSLSQ